MEEVKDKDAIVTSETGVEPSVSPEDEVQAKDGNGAPVSEKMPRELFYERIRASRPDGKYSDDNDDEYYNQANDIIDTLTKDSDRYKAFESKLIARAEEDPEEFQAFLDYLDGTPLIAAIRRYKGDEALTMQEGMEGWDEYQQAGEDRKKRYKEQLDLSKQIRDNFQKSKSDFEEYAQELGLNEDEKKKLWESVLSDLEPMSRGIYTRENFKNRLNALNHDSDVEGAKRQGEIEGKNKAIEAKRAKMDGSGLPNGSAGGNANEGTELSDRERLAQHMATFRRG